MLLDPNLTLQAAQTALEKSHASLDLDSIGASLKEQHQLRDMKAKLLQTVAGSLRERFEKPGNFSESVPKRELLNKRLIKSLVRKLKQGGHQLRELENIETQLNLNRPKAPLAA